MNASTTSQIDILADPIQVAFRRLNVGHDKGYELIKRGEIRTYKIGKRRYMSRAAQAEFIARREAAAASGKAA